MQQAAFSKTVSFRTSPQTGVGISPRTAGRKLINMSFRTSSQTGVGISARAAGRIFKTVSFRTSPQTGVGISPVIETAISIEFQDQERHTP